MLDVEDLHKNYGPIKAVDGVSFAVGAGEAVALLGPNGAGKTTVVSIMTGVLAPDSGRVRVEGRPLGGDVDPAKARLGLVPQELALYDDLSARENLRFFASLYGLETDRRETAIDRALAVAGLADRARDRVRTFSGGMKRRLNLAAALMHQPTLMILDEPTVGVDPQSRLAIFERIEALRAEGMAIVYTTHYMEEAERLCDRVVVMDHGKVLANETLGALLNRAVGAGRLVIELTEPAAGRAEVVAAIESLKTRPEVATARIEEPATVAVELAVGRTLAESAPGVLGVLADAGIDYVHIHSDRPTLESVFIHLTGRSLRDS